VYAPRGHTNIRKRLLIHTGGFNLGLLMRQLIGVGTPRGLQGRFAAVLAALLTLIQTFWKAITRHQSAERLFSRLEPLSIATNPVDEIGVREPLSPRAARGWRGGHRISFGRLRAVERIAGGDRTNDPENISGRSTIVRATGVVARCVKVLAAAVGLADG
jgi:hypothetical protein